MAYYPDDPYGGLDDDRKAVFDSIPGTDFFQDRQEEAHAESLYALGFGYTAEEYDAMGIDENDVHEFREQFFDFMGLEWDDFPWDEWREAMGYD